VAARLGAPIAKKNDAAKSIKKTLSLVIERRNKIAHEGDLQPPRCGNHGRSAKLTLPLLRNK
jgi:hypothetical protein